QRAGRARSAARTIIARRVLGVWRLAPKPALASAAHVSDGASAPARRPIRWLYGSVAGLLRPGERTLTSRKTRARRPPARPRTAGRSTAVDAEPSHVPVLLDEALAALTVRPDGWYVDGTLGLGGHAAAILDASSPAGRLLGIDADPAARQLARAQLAPYGERVLIAAGNNRDLAALCQARSFEPVDGVLLDLGVSSLQFGPRGRGFTFSHEAPLDMRMDPSA